MASDEGTQRDIYLSQTLQDRPAAPRPAASKPIAVQATLRLLLLDDDPLVRSSATSLLKAYGYDVLTASSGIDSLRRLATELPFDVVILDLTMPEMSGIETYHEIRSAWPRQPIVFCSGYSNESGGLDELPEGARPPLLAKPFRIEEMQAVLASVHPKASSKPATATMKL